MSGILIRCALYGRVQQLMQMCQAIGRQAQQIVATEYECHVQPLGCGDVKPNQVSIDHVFVHRQHSGRVLADAKGCTCQRLPRLLAQLQRKEGRLARHGAA
uniref:Uncharacterized protein n=1 Tax=Calcidiscus leptoporus TaxID=127549 RepID=A0A7S0NSJ2_9EUKA